jgi:multiple sugar transport system permease protein
MSFLTWIAVIALAYWALWGTLLVTIDGLRRRRWRDAGLLALGYALAALVVSLYTANYAHAGITHPSGVPALARFGWFVGLACIWLLVVGRASSDNLAWQDVKRRKELSRQIKLHLALVTGAIVFSVPFYWLVTTSLKPDARTNQFPPDLIPVQQASVKIDGEDRQAYFLADPHGGRVRVAKMAELEGDKWQVWWMNKEQLLTVPRASLAPDLHPVLVWKNYSDALAFLPPEYNHGLRPLWNTIYVTLLVILGTVLSSSLVAFSFARLRWPGRDVLFVVLIATMMIPPAVTMLPVFLIFRSLNWIDTLRPLWVPALFGSAFNVFLLRQFFMTIPNDLEDAAKIDGCSYFTIYWKIMLPLIKPALAAITIFAFMGSWNNFMGPLIYISSPENMTLAYALQLFQGMHGGEPAMMMAAATLVMLPVLAVFFFTQRYMIQGVTLTGIKG